MKPKMKKKDEDEARFNQDTPAEMKNMQDYGYGIPKTIQRFILELLLYLGRYSRRWPMSRMRR